MIRTIRTALIAGIALAATGIASAQMGDETSKDQPEHPAFALVNNSDFQIVVQCVQPREKIVVEPATVDSFQDCGGIYYSPKDGSGRQLLKPSIRCDRMIETHELVWSNSGADPNRAVVGEICY